MRGLAWDGGDRIGPRRRPVDRPPTPLAVLPVPEEAVPADERPDGTEPDRNAPGGAPAGRPLGIPALSLVVLIGVSGSGKSTFARAALPADSRCISSDFCRGLVADDENDQSATADAFEVLALHRRQAAGGRAADRDRRHQRPARAPASRWSTWPVTHDVLPVAIVLDVPENLRAERNAAGPTATFGRAGGPPPACRAAPLAASTGTGRVPACVRAPRGRRGGGGQIVREPLRDRLHRPGRALRRHRRRARLPRPNWKPCSGSSATPHA